MWLGATTTESDQRVPIASVGGQVLETRDQSICDDVADAVVTVDQDLFDEQRQVLSTTENRDR